MTICVCLTVLASGQTQEPSASNAPVHRHIAETWLQREPNLRLLEDEDCVCSDSVAFTRTDPEHTDFKPFYVAADFNRDSHEDFAVMVGQRMAAARRAVVVFNGPFDPKAKSVRPTFLWYFPRGFDARSWAFYMNKYDGAHLFIGVLETDNGMELVWRRGRYLLRYIPEA